MTSVEARPNTYDIVVPTVGRESLRPLLDVLDAQYTARRTTLIVVDDRVSPTTPLLTFESMRPDVVVLRSGGRGPAAARNAGAAIATAPWVVFLDDDVAPTATWASDLERDLDGVSPEVGGVQGRIVVPLPATRRPTDWERNVAGLERAQWATADMAYRREMLQTVGGFDERFPRAYREDADVGLRFVAGGARITRGKRVVQHPVRPAPWAVSIAKQAGNADDALMGRLHGPGWRTRAGVPRGRRRRHIATTTAAAVAVGAAASHRRAIAIGAGVAWGTLTVEFLLRRIAPGPRTTSEVATMIATSVAIPPVATAAWLRGFANARRVAPASRRAAGSDARRPVDAVLFDRDGTLVVDVPYNADPDYVRPVAGAREAIARLRAAGIPVAVISNQSGVGRGLLCEDDVDAVNARVDALLGPFGAFCVCVHGPDDGCACRKPAPGLVIDAAGRLGVDPKRCAVIGDIGADVEAARAAGAFGVLVPTPVTRPTEIASAPIVAPTISIAVDLILEQRGVVA
ncbi:MAG: HAD-superfamily hydrolase subfamily [Actinomycetia bacterium]|nr:HAD-superfamily hydrolase subfamily [Actinomycetes bacterium]